MRMWKKITIGIILFSFVSGISFFVGGVLGYIAGLSDRTVLVSATEGMYKARILQAIREGRIDSGVDLLEISLDSDIIAQGSNYVLYGHMGASDEKFMTIIANYRKQYPTKATDPDVKKRIEQTLKKYETTGDK